MTVIQNSKLFEPITVGSTALKHRVVLAPMTRTRASQTTGIPSEHTIEYYTQRASEGGLLITEGLLVAEEDMGFPFVPAIWSSEHVQAWKTITAAVHAKGGKIYSQIGTVGRIAMPSLVPKVFSPSTIPAEGGSSTDLTSMTVEDIDRFVEHYRKAAVNAVEAGFDGIEIHNCSGFLLDQFVQSVSNDRTDDYGGSVANRIRFPLRAIAAVCSVIGASKVGVRISPFSRFQSMREPDPMATFVPYVEALLKAQPELGYVHAVEARADEITGTLIGAPPESDNLDAIREAVKRLGKGTAFIVSGGYTPESAKEHAEKYDGELISFGRYFTSNPDLPDRIKNGWPLQKYKREFFYAQTPEGYIDFPIYSAQTEESVAATA
ncbi:hypothetical protein IAT38_007819 [Cryptococcus sp. DSM 104549]